MAELTVSISRRARKVLEKEDHEFAESAEVETTPRRVHELLRDHPDELVVTVPETVILDDYVDGEGETFLYYHSGMRVNIPRAERWDGNIHLPTPPKVAPDILSQMLHDVAGALTVNLVHKDEVEYPLDRTIFDFFDPVVEENPELWEQAKGDGDDKAIIQLIMKAIESVDYEVNPLEARNQFTRYLKAQRARGEWAEERAAAA